MFESINSLQKKRSRANIKITVKDEADPVFTPQETELLFNAKLKDLHLN